MSAPLTAGEATDNTGVPQRMAVLAAATTRGMTPRETVLITKPAFTKEDQKPHVATESIPYHPGVGVPW
jgi:hypothetical protein